jgi:CBS domain containing-hemolysin-like protein
MIQVMMYLIYSKKVKTSNMNKNIHSLVLEQYHLGVVVEYDNTSEKDPKARAVGIVTLEDIIEEMIQEEIIDETDVFSK